MAQKIVKKKIKFKLNKIKLFKKKKLFSKNSIAHLYK